MLHEMVHHMPVPGTHAEERAPLRARLKREKEFLQARLDRVDRALFLLDGQPELADFLELLEQVQ